MKLFLIFSLALVPALALADDASDHAAKATRSYNIQDWPHALDEYKQAYALDPRPETLWAIAQTQRLSGDCRSAILTYKAYVRGASSAGANAAMEWIKTCEADVEAQRKAVDAATQTPPPESKPKSEPAPKPMLEPRPAKREARRSWVFDPLGDVLVIAGIGGLAAGGAFFAIGALDANGAPAKPTSGDYDRTASSAHSEQLIGAIAGGAGALFTALAIWRFASVRSDTTEHVQSFALVPTHDGAFATFATRF